jgi:hypothetical protein
MRGEKRVEEDVCLVPNRLSVRFEVHLLGHAPVDINCRIVVERRQLGQDRQSQESHGKGIGIIQFSEEEGRESLSWGERELRWSSVAAHWLAGLSAMVLSY